MITLKYSRTLSETRLDEGSTCRREFYLRTHKTHDRQTSMPPAELETAIPASERPQTYALVRAATRIGSQKCTLYLNQTGSFIYLYCQLGLGGGEGKIHPGTGHEVPEGEYRYS